MFYQSRTIFYLLPFKKENFSKTFKRKRITIVYNLDGQYHVKYEFHDTPTVINMAYPKLNDCYNNYVVMTFSGILYSNRFLKIIDVNG